MIKKAPAGTATQIADERQSQLKLLIARGKEQGYLTYAEVNDHLPSEIVDPEQIEDIVNMINDMGIPVYEKAPDAESLLLTDATAAPDEEAVEEATAALANLDAEFGRTTDPVRMYMREMGTVELLTREGEIRIAKRIEEGLEAVKIALGSYPGTYDLLLRHYETVKAGQMRLVDVIVGFVDPNAPDEIAQPQNPKMMALEREEAANDDDEADGDEDEEAIDTGPDPEEAAKRFDSIAQGASSILECARQARIEGSRRRRRFASKHLQRVHGAQALAEDVRPADRQSAPARDRGASAREGNHVPLHQAGRHAAQGFHLDLSEERDQHALARQAHQGEEALLGAAREIQGRDRAPPEQAQGARGPVPRADQRDQGDQPRGLDRRGQGAPREEGDGRGQPAPGDLDRQEIHQPRPAVPRSDPGRQHRPDEGRRQVRVSPRLQILAPTRPGGSARPSRARSPIRRAPSASRCT